MVDRGQARNLEQRNQVQADEGKSSQSSERWPQAGPSRRSEQMSDEYRSRPKPQTQHQQHQKSQGGWQKDRKPQQQGEKTQQQRLDQRPKQKEHEQLPDWRSAPQNPPQQWQSQPDNRQGLKNQRGDSFQQPRNQRREYSRAESLHSNQSFKSQATSSGEAAAQRKRPPPLTDEDLEKQGIEKLRVDYKGSGKNGQPLGNIETNYVKLSIKNILENIYHYDVTFVPERPKKFLENAFKRFVGMNSQNRMFSLLSMAPEMHTLLNN